MLKFMSVIVMFSMLFGGTGISVAAAQASTPGELLYPVKLLSEEVQIKLCEGHQSQLKLALMFTQRRFEEIQSSLAENELPTNQAMLQYQNQLRYSLQLALKLNQPEEGLAPIQNMLQTHLFQMQQLKQNEITKPFQFQMAYLLQYYQELADMGFEDPQELQQQLQFEYQYQLKENILPLQNMQSVQQQFQAGPQGADQPQEVQQPPVEAQEPIEPDNTLNKGKGGKNKP